MSLGVTLREQGDPAGARRLEEHVVEVIRRLYGSEDRVTLAGMQQLATALRLLGWGGSPVARGGISEDVPGGLRVRRSEHGHRYGDLALSSRDGSRSSPPSRLP